MFTSLLESNPARSSRLGGSLVSVIAHGALIVGAVVFTAHATAAPEAPEDVHTVFTAPPPPLPPTPAAAEQRRQTSSRPTLLSVPLLVAPVAIPDLLPTIDLTVPATSEAAWTSGVRGGVPDGVASGGNVGGASAADVFTREAVDRPVVMQAGSATPRYPDMLRAGGIEGVVVAQFVVDTLGRVDPASVRILDSSHPLFSTAVINALPRLRFLPAEIGGRKVMQLVQQPFRFGLH